MASNESTHVRKRRGRPPAKTEIDRSVPAAPDTLDQATGRRVPDGPAGIVAADSLPASSPAGPGPGHRRESSGSGALEAQGTYVNPRFLDAMGRGRALELVEEHGPWVLIEPQVGSVFVPDYAAGPATRLIGGEIHRYYRPLRLAAKLFDLKTRAKLADADRAWIPRREFQALERKAAGSVAVVDRSDGGSAQAA